MTKVEFTPYILRETADIYSFRIEGGMEVLREQELIKKICG